MKFNSRSEFRKYLTDNNIVDIPINPNYIYKNEWISLYDWIGKEKVSNKNISKISYDDAKNKVNNLIFGKKIDSKGKWIQFYEENLKLLFDIPKHPNIAYKSIGWISWTDWLGTRSSSDKIEYSLDEVINLIVENNIQTRREYYSLCSELGLPTNPIKKFNLKKWSDILCKKSKRKNDKFLCYEKAKCIIVEMSLKSQREWYRLCKTGKIPSNIPKTPNKFYEEWISWNDWLGHNITTNKKFISYKKARQYLSNIGIGSLQEYYDFVISEKIDFLPLSPISYYKGDYKSVSDFLSNNNSISYGERKILKYLESNNIEYKHQFKFDECKNVNKLIFDFYVPSLNTIIEFDGRQHFEPIEFFGGLEDFEKLKVRDSIKNDFCEKNKINLLRISYEDINIIDKILDRAILKK
jgi:very-short-patch-repair endonuclease